MCGCSSVCARARVCVCVCVQHLNRCKTCTCGLLDEPRLGFPNFSGFAKLFSWLIILLQGGQCMTDRHCPTKTLSVRGDTESDQLHVPANYLFPFQFDRIYFLHGVRLYKPRTGTSRFSAKGKKGQFPMLRQRDGGFTKKKTNIFYTQWIHQRWSFPSCPRSFLPDRFIELFVHLRCIPTPQVDQLF